MQDTSPDFMEMPILYVNLGVSQLSYFNHKVEGQASAQMLCPRPWVSEPSILHSLVQLVVLIPHISPRNSQNLSASSSCNFPISQNIIDNVNRSQMTQFAEQATD